MTFEGQADARPSKVQPHQYGGNTSKARATILRSVTILAIAVALTHLFWSFTFTNSLNRTVALPQSEFTDPADEWRDNDWPYHEQEPWDISTDYMYPRTLEYEVDEGTWMRLDVHPVSGEIVFDLLGDLYCLTPVSSRAHPILLGIPHDGDPHFSPEGDRLAFRSDAELGVDNIWIVAWEGCENAALRPHPELEQHGVSLRYELLDALSLQSEDEASLSNGAKETSIQTRRRLIREGRLGAQRITNETYRFVTDPRFHASGTKVIASKWYTSGRTIPAGEGWLYDIPTISDLRQGSHLARNNIQAGDGKRVISRTLPPGWTAEKYSDQQIGNEQFIWNGNDSLIYSKKKSLESSGIFEYSSDVHSGIYGIYSRNITTGETKTLVNPYPGSASRPELSRDSNTLAFVRRVRDKEALVLLDLRSGSLHHIWYGLTYDATPIAAPMGTYPSFSFTPRDDGIIIWAAGKIYRVPLSTNSHGEKISGGPPIIIPFTCKVEKRLAETVREPTKLLDTETADRQRVHALKELAVDDSGKKVLFQAAGVTYIQGVGSSSPAAPVPVLDASAAYYSPSFVPGRPDLVLHCKWSEINFTTFELSDVLTGNAHDLSEGLPLGRYISPVLCDSKSPKRKIAFIRLSGDILTGDILATGNPGIIIADITLPPLKNVNEQESPSSTAIPLQNLQFIPSEINLEDDSLLRLRFVDKSTKLIVQDLGRTFLVDLGTGPDQFGRYRHETLVTAKTGSEVAVTPVIPHPDVTRVGIRHVAFIDFYHVFLVEGKYIYQEPLQSKPGRVTRGLSQLSVDGGHDIAWSRDGKKLFWLLGPYLHYVDVDLLAAKTTTIPTVQEIFVLYDSDIARLKLEGQAAAVTTRRGLDNSDMLAITNATLLTFATGHFNADYIPKGTLLTKAGVITKCGPADEVAIPSGAHVIDAHGGLLIPGYVDVHAHWSGFSVQHPTRSWELETFLAYGITTLHNPSSDNRDGYHERFLVESGKILGPRIFHTGNIIYGGGERGIHQDIVNIDEARSALLRIKAEGGPSSFSYKNYQLPSRASRQRLLLAARNFSMLAVPEGGMSYDWDLTYIIDGMATVEHAIPIPVLYDDVLTLYAQSGTASTPTHIVNYGGAMGEQLVWATVDVPNDTKLRRFTRHDILEGLTETTKRPFESYALFNTSASVAKLVARGALANIGAHGEPPLGLIYHAEMKFAMAGGLTAYEVLRAATRDGARSLGLFDSIGSLSPGKLADLVLYPEGIDYEHFHDLHPSREPRFVVRGGRVFDANTMTEEWPVKGRRQVLPVINAD